MLKKKSDIDRLVRSSKKFRDAHKSVVSRLAEGYLLCANCKTEVKLDVTQVENYLREGFPKCCPDTLLGGVMRLYRESQRRHA